MSTQCTLLYYSASCNNAPNSATYKDQYVSAPRAAGPLGPADPGCTALGGSAEGHRAPGRGPRMGIRFTSALGSSHQSLGQDQEPSQAPQAHLGPLPTVPCWPKQVTWSSHMVGCDFMMSCGKEGDEGLGATMHLPQARAAVTELGAPLGSPAPQSSPLTIRLHCLTVLGRG